MGIIKAFTFLTVPLVLTVQTVLPHPTVPFVLTNIKVAIGVNFTKLFSPSENLPAHSI